MFLVIIVIYVLVFDCVVISVFLEFSNFFVHDWGLDVFIYNRKEKRDNKLDKCMKG